MMVPMFFLETFNKIPLKAGLLYAAYFCQVEVCNGGFNQFFSNSTGVLAPEAVRGLRAIQQNQIADLVEKAMSSFGNEYPRDRVRRRALLAGFHSGTFDNQEEHLFELIDSEKGGFTEAANAYASS